MFEALKEILAGAARRPRSASFASDGTSYISSPQILKALGITREQGCRLQVRAFTVHQEDHQWESHALRDVNLFDGPYDPNCARCDGV